MKSLIILKIFFSLEPEISETIKELFENISVLMNHLVFDMKIIFILSEENDNNHKTNNNRDVTSLVVP